MLGALLPLLLLPPLPLPPSSLFVLTFTLAWPFDGPYLLCLSQGWRFGP